MTERTRRAQVESRLMVIGWIAVVAAAGCTPVEAPREDPGEIDVPEIPSPVETGDDRATGAPPPLVAETLLIEGMPEVVPAVVFESPPDFPLPFRTTMPRDLVAERVDSAGVSAVRFEAAFAGVRRPDVALEFGVLAPGTEEGAARARAEAMGKQFGATRRTEQVPPWAVDAYDVVAETAAFVALGTHDDRWFYFFARYPPEFGDGMAPRIDLILRRWTWADAGPPLIH